MEMEPWMRGASLDSAVHLFDGPHESDTMPPLFFQELSAANRMVIVWRGEVTFYAGTVAYTVHADDLLILPVQLCHALFPGPGAQWTLLEFLPQHPENTLHDCQLYSFHSQPLIRSMLEMMRAPQLLQSSRVQMLEALLLQLSLSPHIAFHTAAPDTLPLQILAYLNEHFREDLSLQELSARFHISPSHMIHIFNPLFELSPMQYVIQRRIGEAQHLLLTTDCSASEIAGEVGIPNRNHFYSTFKRFVGLTPSAYRAHFRCLPVQEESS